ncbi:MAG: hypothetical protein R6V07_02200 [Armatimonadota bacterium]
MERIRDWVRNITKTISGWWQRQRAPGRFLCDSCRYDYGDVCSRPARPNAKRCPDYRRR